jgi:hypothetical protein
MAATAKNRDQLMQEAGDFSRAYSYHQTGLPNVEPLSNNLANRIGGASPNAGLLDTRAQRFSNLSRELLMCKAVVQLTNQESYYVAQYERINKANDTPPKSNGIPREILSQQYEVRADV